MGKEPGPLRSWSWLPRILRREPTSSFIIIIRIRITAIMIIITIIIIVNNKGAPFSLFFGLRRRPAETERVKGVLLKRPRIL